MVVSGANETLTGLTAAQRETIKGSAYLVLQCELPIPALVEGIAVARAAGVFTVLTPAPVVPLPEGFLASADLVVPNRIEAAALTGETDPVLRGRGVERRNTWAIVTLGAEGSVIAHNGRSWGSPRPGPCARSTPRRPGTRSSGRSSPGWPPGTGTARRR